jgi:hypothetical protein
VIAVEPLLRMASIRPGPNTGTWAPPDDPALKVLPSIKLVKTKFAEYGAQDTPIKTELRDVEIGEMTETLKFSEPLKSYGI